MNNRYQSTLKASVLALALMMIAGVVGSSTQACANAITPQQVSVELMITAQHATNVFIAHVFGVDSTAPLSFASHNSEQGFTFSLSPGSSYLGKSITVEDTGGCGSPWDWQLTSSIKCGDVGYRLSCSATLTLVSESVTAGYFAWQQSGPVGRGLSAASPAKWEYYVSVKYSIHGNDVRSSGTYDQYWNDIYMGSGTFDDVWYGAAKDWHLISRSTNGDSLAVVSHGSVNPSTGVGSFTALITPRAPNIPTLSEWGVIIFGTLLMGSVVFYVWRRRRAAVV